jgi:hypothetical protein
MIDKHTATIFTTDRTIMIDDDIVSQSWYMWLMGWISPSFWLTLAHEQCESYLKSCIPEGDYDYQIHTERLSGIYNLTLRYTLKRDWDEDLDAMAAAMDRMK